jgi:hypothetical protein
MQHALSSIERAILVGVTADLDRLQQTPLPGVFGDPELKLAIEDAADGLVRCDAARWLGITAGGAAARMRISRAYARLQRRGLVQRVACGFSGAVTSHLRLTKAGIALAKLLCDQGQVDG